MKKIFKLQLGDLNEMVDSISDKILKEDFGFKVNKSPKKASLNESDLHRVIENATKKILKEDFGY
jgi:hypothetical protein